MFAGSSVATQFHQAFYTQLVQEIFAVMTGGCRLMVQARECAGCRTAICCQGRLRQSLTTVILC